MSKTKIKYICSNCGYESLRWIGRCPECESWNTFTEEIVETSPRKANISKSRFSYSKILEISANEDDRMKTGIIEFDRVLGGGIMPGSVILLGGDPGIGKTHMIEEISRLLRKELFVFQGHDEVSPSDLACSVRFSWSSSTKWKKPMTLPVSSSARSSVATSSSCREEAGARSSRRRRAPSTRWRFAGLPCCGSIGSNVRPSGGVPTG